MLVEFVWANVALPFPTIQFSPKLEVVKILDNIVCKFPIHMKLTSFANSTKLKRFSAVNVDAFFDCILPSPPQNIFLFRISSLCSLTLQVGMK